MSKNALRICYESSTIFRIGEFVAKVWTFQIFWSEIPIGLQITRTDYGLYNSFKIFANWVPFSHESKYLSLHGDSWDSGPVWNKVIKQYFLHILSLETDNNPSWINRKWRMNVYLLSWPISRNKWTLVGSQWNSWTLDEQPLGLPPTELRDPIKLYSHMNITDSMNVHHWTDIRRRC